MISAEEHARRMALYDTGLLDSQIAEQLGNVTFHGICQWRNVRGLPSHGKKPRPKGEITPLDQMQRELQEACDFRKLRQPGVPIWRSVAEHYGVDPTEAYNHIQELLFDEEDFA